MIRRIALISPFDSFLAVGLRMISSHLRANGVDTRMIFLPAYDEIWKQLFNQNEDQVYSDSLLSEVRDLVADCDAVGITMMSMEKPRVQTLMRAVAPLNKPVVLGGIHPTAFPDDAIEMSDIIVQGEGEAALLEWCQAPDRTDIPNTWVRKNGIVHRNPVRPAVMDIDTLPFPDYSLDDHWILHRRHLQPMTEDLRHHYMGAIYHHFATLGCPFSCTFCINSRFKKMESGYGKFRTHSIDYMIADIKYGLSLSPHIEYINFPDDGFIAMKEEQIEQFADQYKREIGLPFSVMGIIPNYLSERKLDLLVGAGLKRVRLGLQSSDVETLRTYRRPGRPEMYRKCNDMLQRHKDLVFPYYDIIVDNPLVDTEKDIVESIKFLTSLKGRFTVILYSMKMYPGTQMYEEALEANVDKSFFEDSYYAINNHFLNYILTVIQCTNIRFIPKFMLAIYRRTGNFRVPRTLFSINKALFVFRGGLEHLRKGDRSATPRILMKCLRLINLQTPLRRGQHHYDTERNFQEP